MCSWATTTGTRASRPNSAPQSVRAEHVRVDHVDPLAAQVAHELAARGRTASLRRRSRPTTRTPAARASPSTSAAGSTAATSSLQRVRHEDALEALAGRGGSRARPRASRLRRSRETLSSRMTTWVTPAATSVRGLAPRDREQRRAEASRSHRCLECSSERKKKAARASPIAISTARVSSSPSWSSSRRNWRCARDRGRRRRRR